MRRLKILTVVGARPQFIKASAVSRAIRGFNGLHPGWEIREIVLHTGQHYDENMSKVFFDELDLPSPDYNLGIGSGQHGVQTGQMLEGVEKVLEEEKPDMVMVYGDTNSTIAGALAAAKLHVPVAHVEAGLRSFNRRMPEEVNRVLTDHVSDILFCPTVTAVNNLKAEGLSNIIERGRLLDHSTGRQRFFPLPVVMNVGDVMYDSILHYREEAKGRSHVMDRLGLEEKGFYLATIHRAENTDDPVRLKSIFKALNRAARRFPVIVPLHPRTGKGMAGIDVAGGVRIVSPLPYLDMILLTASARLVLTDSGGVQKEAFFMNVPCITLRDETEWVETLRSGMNVLAGAGEKKIVEAVRSHEQVRHQGRKRHVFGDGNAAGRIIAVIRSLFRRGRCTP